MEGKVIHLIRHAEGFHNLRSTSSDHRYDANLTPRGWSQTQMLRDELHQTAFHGTVQLVVVSPLTRTLQTAAGIFGEDEGSDGSLCLMASCAGRRCWSPHARIYKPTYCPPFLVEEMCREAMSPDLSSTRRPVSKLSTEFPVMDFSNVIADRDEWWIPEEESKEDLRERTRAFLRWLIARPEQEIAVVSHGNFLFDLANCYCEEFGGEAEIRKRFHTCEMRTIAGGRLGKMFVPEEDRKEDRSKEASKEARKISAYELMQMLVKPICSSFQKAYASYLKCRTSDHVPYVRSV